MDNNLDNDLATAPKDEKKLQPETAVINLPDVNDIPGQQHVHPPHLHEFADTTAASADEEGDGLFEDDDDGLNSAAVTAEERELLARTAYSMSTEDDQDAFAAELDDTDLDGDPLNEKTDISGKDLDAEGTEEGEEREDGEEDEENSTYSLADDQ